MHTFTQHAELHIVGIPNGTKCVPLVAYFCFVKREASYFVSLTIIGLVLLASRYLDDLLNFDNF